MFRPFSLVLLLLLSVASVRAADEAQQLPKAGKPVLQLEAGGPTATVNAMQFSADGKTLFAAGLDKVVRVWEDDPTTGWTLKRSFRVPIGSGAAGLINALALSPDGRWLAVGGRSVLHSGEAAFNQVGVVMPNDAISESMWRSSGTIHVFDLRNPAGGKELRGHLGEVRALAFAPARDGKPSLLVSAAIERSKGKPFGSVRLWDVAQGGEALAVLDEKLPITDRLFEPPGLAVWHTGNGKKDVRVAIAWPETAPGTDQGELRLWDAAAKEYALQKWDSGAFNGPAAFLGVAGAEARVVTGSVTKFGNDVTGGLRVWNFSKDADTKATLERQISFLLDNIHHRPLALTPVSTGANGQFDRVAAVAQYRPTDRDIRNYLTLTDLAQRKVDKLFELQNTAIEGTPKIAAAPYGKWLAVAGFKDPAIEMYLVADLINGKQVPAKRLRSNGVLYSNAVFVKRGKETGLWLSEDAKAEPLQNGSFFNFEKGTLTGDAKGWTSDKPSTDGWVYQDEVKKDSGVWTARFSEGKVPYPKITLKPGEMMTKIALRPATARHKQALLAVAHTNPYSQETYITLFDVRSGQPVRKFIGHLQNVVRLAFSDTYPLLVSTSEDQTVRVWSFADLNAGVGMIQGVVASDRAGKVVVHSVEANSAAATAGLKSGDVIEGFTGADGKVQEVKSAVDFYWTVNLKKPGDAVDLKVADKPALRMAVGRGVDVRNPLLSLFVTRDRAKRIEEWIGWTPGGPFDRSSNNADTFLGWHINTGKPEQPVTFAAAGEYQKEFHKKNILKYLIDKGNLGDALKEHQKQDGPVPDPKLTTSVQGGNRDRQQDAKFHLRQKNAKLTVQLNEDYPLDPQDKMQWRVTGPDNEKTELRPLTKTTERSWEADLSMLPWKRGEFSVEVVFNSKKRDKNIVQTLTLRYQPPAPQVAALAEKKEIKANAEPLILVVAEPKITLDVTAKPALEQKVEVRFVQTEAKEVLKPRVIAKEETFRQEFVLQEGVNHIEIVAVNKDALHGFEANETSVLRVQVQYQKPMKQPLPRLAVVRIVPASQKSFRDGEDREVLVVERPHLEVSSEILAKHPLTLAEWSVGDDKAISLLDPQTPMMKIELRRPIELKAGKTVTLRLRAATKTSEPAEATLRVIYRPPLPRISIAPSEEETAVFRNEVKVGGLLRVLAVGEKHQFEVRVKDAQGKEVGPVKVEIDEKHGTWTGVATLAHGENVIEATVRNDWQSAVTESITVTYKRPPIIEKIADIQVGDKPFVDIAAKVWSPKGVKLLGAVLNATEVETVDLKETAETKDGLMAWKVTIKDVPVKTGEKWVEALVLNVRNSDGLSREPITIGIKPPAKPVPIPPVVKLNVPDQDRTQQLKYHVPFFIQSDSPLKSVEVWRGDERVHQADLKKVKKKGAKFELNETEEIALDWGTNRLRLVAINDGGQADSPEAVVTALRPPVRIVIDKIEMPTLDGKNKETFLPLEQTLAEQVRFPELPRGFLSLHGHVEYTDLEDGQLNDPLRKVEAYVNGVRQFPVALGPRGAGKDASRRSFEVPMTLSKKEGNKIVIELPSMKQEENSGSEFSLNCQVANEKQRLHVLIVGVGVRDSEKLKLQVLSIFDSSDLPSGLEGGFKSKAFDKAWLAGVLVEDVTKYNVLGRLGEIEEQIRVWTDQDKWQNDVVLIYFQGSEAVGKDGKTRYLKMSVNERNALRPLETTAIALKDMYLPRLPGVQLMVLNVAPPAGNAAVGEDGKLGNKSAGLMRYVVNNNEETKNPESSVVTSLNHAAQELKKGAKGSQGITCGELFDLANKKVDEKQLARVSSKQIPKHILDLVLVPPR